MMPSLKITLIFILWRFKQSVISLKLMNLLNLSFSVICAVHMCFILLCYIDSVTNYCSGNTTMSGGFQFGTPNTTSATGGGTGVGGFSFGTGTPSSQAFAFATPSCTTSGGLFGSAFGTTAGSSSLFGASTQPSATTTTTTGFSLGMFIC